MKTFKRGDLKRGLQGLAFDSPETDMAHMFCFAVKRLT
jgi:hypothetical protein